MKARLLTVSLLAGAAGIAAFPLLAKDSSTSGPIARYDMRAGTVAGIGSMAAMNPMAMIFGGGKSNQVQHELILRLGSSSAPDKGKPKADHFMPPTAKLGKSVALVTPRSEPEAVDQLPWEEPKGRILIYWGCGEHAPKGQPVVIDLSNLAKGQVPPGLWTSTIQRDWGPTVANSTTFGRWPAEDGKYAKPDTSLIGAHRIAGNYSPEISFTLTKDFMAPLKTATLPQPSGAKQLNWNTIPEATGFIATVVGGKMNQQTGDMGDLVMWSSSSNRQFGGGLSDWLSPSQVAPLVKDKTLLGPAIKTCTIPAEVIRDAPDFRFGTLTAFGPEENFSYPPRPTDAKARWDLQWTARIRHRSTTGWMEAAVMSMGAQGGAQGSQGQSECKPRGGLGGMLGGVLGGGGSGC